MALIRLKTGTEHIAGDPLREKLEKLRESLRGRSAGLAEQKGLIDHELNQLNQDLKDSPVKVSARG